MCKKQMIEADSLLIKFYEEMFLIRFFEEKLEELFKKGDLFGTIHGCVGQEAVAVGIVNALSKDDIITGNHRSHGHFLAYSGDVEGLMGEIMGKECGVVKGRGGSQHIYKENFYSNGVQGSLVPVAAGMALAEKIKGANNIVVCFIGDGTLGQGVLYESLNMASLWKLPILYIVENNLYAMSTGIEEGVAGSMVGRGEAFGIESSRTASGDVEILHNQAKDIVSKVRGDCSPYFWVVDTYRLCGHSKGDDKCYRTKKEEDLWSKSDPLLIAGSKIPKDMRNSIEEKCKKRIAQTYKKVRSGDYPSTANL